MQSLNDALNRASPVTPIGVSLTDGVLLNVTVADTGLMWAPCDQQVAMAIRVAHLVRDHYPELASLQVLSVTFAAGKPDTLAPRPARLPVRFPPAAVRAGLTAADSVQAVNSCRAFEELNQ
jgi:hypothetical protein